MDDDSLDLSELTFEEKVAFLEEELPAPIRNFLQSPERDAVSLRLSQKYNLHADQAGAFEKAYLYMLLGVNTPEDFVQDLKDAEIDEATVRDLTTDINEQVFKKLQQQELAEPAAPVQAYRSVPERPPVPVMEILPAPSAQSIISTPATAPAATQPTPAPSAPLPPPPTPSYKLIRPDAVVSAPQPLFRTMQSDMEALQHPTVQASQDMSTMPGIPHPSQVSPARSFQTASVPYTSTPVASIPLPPEPVFRPAPLPAPIQPLPQAPRPSLQPNSSGDPYRESF